MNTYPKVLVIGNTFHKKSGSGITMSNLFSGWPKDKLATATYNISISEPEICNNYYRLGNKEDIRPWLFELFHVKKPSGELILSSSKDQNDLDAGEPVTRRNKLYFIVHTISERLIILGGLYHYIYKLRVSDEFIGWVRTYNPDIIYAQAASLSLVSFINRVYEITGIPYVIHIMDDHYKTMVRGGIFTFLWKRILKTEYLQLLNNASALMSICETMSREYKKRFNREFIPFHNPISIGSWLQYTKKDWSAGKQFVIMYAGRIGISIRDSINDLIRAVDQLRKTGYNIRLDLLINSNSKLPRRFFNISNVNISHAKHEEMPERLSSADLLVLPLDFNKRSVKYAGFSMPTKTSEFMITGVPVLVYAPKYTALTDFALKYKWAYVVNERNIEKLKSALVDLYRNCSLREILGNTAKQIAVEKFSSDIVRKNFHSVLQQAADTK